MATVDDKVAGGAEQLALPDIALPVIARVDVDGYELFPGKTGGGLHHSFAPGVTVLAGINGLGKTTLLNILLRLLLGPFNPEKVTPFEVGAKSHTLIRWKHARQFFSRRVTDEAVAAKARAEVLIGKHTLVVERQLRDLVISFLSFDGEELDPTEVEFERVTLSASNAASRYDFDFLVRYLVFFLEQRVPLFWNDRGQIETFRILLCDSKLATEFQEKQDEIQTKDSLYRNFGWQARKRAKDFRERSAAYAGAGSLSAKASAVQEAFKLLSEQSRGMIARLGEMTSERSELRTKVLLTKIELEEGRRAYEGLQQSFLASIFPSVDSSARYIFSTLLSKRGCAVCGSKAERGYQRLQHLLALGDCPACESPPSDQERAATASRPDEATLKEAADMLSRLQRAVTVLEDKAAALDGQHTEMTLELRRVQRTMQSHSSELEQLKAQLPPTPDELRRLEQQVADDAEVLKDKEAELERLYAEHALLVSAVTERVTQVSDQVREYFSQYAKSFMAESCYLGLSSYKEDVGQNKQFEYPCFEVYMTSATSPDRETVRTNDEDVSESQKEFIDLAFRMALIAAVTSKDARAMLVIETPEASLDAFFVDQAGELLRQFGKGDDPNGNVVIVSSNLARQNMIGALLGLSGEDETTWPDRSAIEAHLVNLIDECRPNAALRDHRDLYEQALDEATKSRLNRRG